MLRLQRSRNLALGLNILRRWSYLSSYLEGWEDLVQSITL